jgi:hypothetical protein
MPLTPEEQNKGLLSFQNEVVDPTGQNRGVGGSVVRRYTAPAPATPTPAVAAPPPATNPVNDYYQGLDKTFTAEDEGTIRENTRKNMQSQIDAINAQYATLVSQEAATQDKLAESSAGQTRAISARSGLLGSDFGQAHIQNDAQNSAKAKSAALAVLENEKQVKLQQIFGNIEARASEEIKARKAEALGNQEKYVQHLEQSQEQARADLKTLAQSGVSLEELDPTQKEALLKQSGYESGMAELIFNAHKPKAAQIDYKFEKLADGVGMFYGVDPVTGELKTQRISTPIPDGFTMTIAPDGTPLIFNKATGEARIADDFGQGQFADPLDQYKKQLEIGKLERELSTVDTTGLTKEQMQELNRIRDDVRQDPDVKNFIEVRDGYERIETGAELGNGPGDLAMLFGYMKMLDPTSVVREAEFANAESALGYAQKILNIPDKFIKGTRLTDEGRQFFVDAAERLYQTKEAQYAKAAEFWGTQLDEAGIPRERGLRDYRAGSASEEVQLTPINGSDLKYFKNPLIQKYPYEEVASFVQQYPDATEAEIKELIGETPGLKDKGGISASSPIAPVAVKYPAGYKGGQTRLSPSHQ